MPMCAISSFFFNHKVKCFFVAAVTITHTVTDCNTLHFHVVHDIIEAVLCNLSEPHTSALLQPATEESVNSTLSAP